MANILVVEDDSDIRDLMTNILKDAGHQVILAKNGDEGIATYQQNQTDLVITDIMMPEKDGIETIRELKKINKEVKIIAITGYRGRFNRLPAAEFLGAQETLLKPFTKADLLSTIDRLI